MDHGDLKSSKRSCSSSALADASTAAAAWRCGAAACLNVLAIAMASIPIAGFAQTVPVASRSDQAALWPEASDASPASTAPSKSTLRDLLGDPGGIRASLAADGIDYDFTYIGEALGNPAGGIKQGATYEGRLGGRLNVDLGILADLPGTSFHASFFETNGRGLSGNNLHDLFIVSGIEAYPSATLYRIYFEQAFGRDLTVRAGQLAADFEFVESPTANVFLNSTFGWPASFTNDLPSGGPAFPLATPGLRVKYRASGSLTILAAVYDGDPAGPYRPQVNNALPQLRDPSGTLFRIADSPLAIAEAQIRYREGWSEARLPGTVKVGYLHHFGAFADYASADPTNATRRGDDGVYGVLDQSIYQVPGSNDRGVSLFARASVLPGDRNLIDLYADLGVALKGVVSSRPNDTFGIAGAYGRISPDLQNQDRRTGTPFARGFQAAIEATYQVRVAPGFTIQPDAQLVFLPGAPGLVGPPGGREPRGMAVVLGLRTTLRY